MRALARRTKVLIRRRGSRQTMDLLEALVLGIIQGITEWLPVSSSGHLVIGQELLGLPTGDNLLFDLMVHMGTVLAVCTYFRRELWRICLALLSRREHRDEQLTQLRLLGLMILLGTVPIALAGVVFADRVDEAFTIELVGAALIVNAVVLVIAERVGSRAEKRTVRAVDAIVIGVFQAIAVLPGISRSGFTISGGMFRGVEREMAATFAFLLSVPALLGAFAYGVYALDEQGSDLLILFAGALSAFVVGLMSIDYLLKAVRSGKLWVFGAYCLILGTAVLAYTSLS